MNASSSIERCDQPPTATMIAGSHVGVARAMRLHTDASARVGGRRFRREHCGHLAPILRRPPYG